MPRILALDTSTDACSVALADGERTLNRFELASKSHTRRLLPMVDEVLAEAGWTLADLDALAFGRGPGSFTGLRIGLGVVQGLAFSRDLPVVGVSTLETMALGYYRAHPAFAQQKRPILAALDARMQEVYWTLVSWSGEPTWIESLHPEAVTPPANVASLSDVQAHSPHLVGIGPGWHYPGLADLKPEHCELEVYPDALHMLPLAQRALANGEAVSAEQAQPAYLRNEVSWKKRQRIRS